jgi:hypothetical protein
MIRDLATQSRQDTSQELDSGIVIDWGYRGDQDLVITSNAVLYMSPGPVIKKTGVPRF